MPTSDFFFHSLSKESVRLGRVLTPSSSLTPIGTKLRLLSTFSPCNVILSRRTLFLPHAGMECGGW